MWLQPCRTSSAWSHSRLWCREDPPRVDICEDIEMQIKLCIWEALMVLFPDCLLRPVVQEQLYSLICSSLQVLPHDSLSGITMYDAKGMTHKPFRFWVFEVYMCISVCIYLGWWNNFTWNIIFFHNVMMQHGHFMFKMQKVCTIHDSNEIFESSLHENQAYLQVCVKYGPRLPYCQTLFDPAYDQN